MFQNIYPILTVILKRDISYSVLFWDRTHNPVLRRIQMTVTVTWLRQLDKEAYNRSTDYEFVSLKSNLLWSGLIRFKPDSVGLNWIQDHLEGSDSRNPNQETCWNLNLTLLGGHPLVCCKFLIFCQQDNFERIL